MKRISDEYTIVKPLPEDTFPCSFSHIFSGGYAAGYYSYKWAEVSLFIVDYLILCQPNLGWTLFSAGTRLYTQYHFMQYQVSLSSLHAFFIIPTFSSVNGSRCVFCIRRSWPRKQKSNCRSWHQVSSRSLKHFDSKSWTSLHESKVGSIPGFLVSKKES